MAKGMSINGNKILINTNVPFVYFFTITLTVALYSLLVILFAAIVAAQQVGDACVVPNPLRQGLYAAHPTDCGQYLKCVHGRFLARPCPRGLHWSTFHVTCNWPQFASCPLGTAGVVVDQPFQGLDPI